MADGSLWAAAPSSPVSPTIAVPVQPPVQQLPVQLPVQQPAVKQPAAAGSAAAGSAAVGTAGSTSAGSAATNAAAGSAAPKSSQTAPVLPSRALAFRAMRTADADVPVIVVSGNRRQFATKQQSNKPATKQQSKAQQHDEAPLSEAQEMREELHFTSGQRVFANFQKTKMFPVCCDAIWWGLLDWTACKMGTLLGQGKVKKVNSDNTYDVQYDDGDVEYNLFKHDLKCVPAGEERLSGGLSHTFKHGMVLYAHAAL